MKGATLEKMVGLLDSNKEGEALNAFKMLYAHFQESGTKWRDLIVLESIASSTPRPAAQRPPRRKHRAPQRDQSLERRIEAALQINYFLYPSEIPYLQELSKRLRTEGVHTLRPTDREALETIFLRTGV